MLVSLRTSPLEWDGLWAERTFVGLRNDGQVLFRDGVARTALVNNVVRTLGR